MRRSRALSAVFGQTVGEVVHGRSGSVPGVLGQRGRQVNQLVQPPGLRGSQGWGAGGLRRPGAREGPAVLGGRGVGDADADTASVREQLEPQGHVRGRRAVKATGSRLMTAALAHGPQGRVFLRRAPLTASDSGGHGSQAPWVTALWSPRPLAGAGRTSVAPTASASAASTPSAGRAAATPAAVAPRARASPLARGPTASPRRGHDQHDENEPQNHQELHVPTPVSRPVRSVSGDSPARSPDQPHLRDSRASGAARPPKASLLSPADEACGRAAFPYPWAGTALPACPAKPSGCGASGTGQETCTRGAAVTWDPPGTRADNVGSCRADRTGPYTDWTTGKDRRPVGVGDAPTTKGGGAWGKWTRPGRQRVLTVDASGRDFLSGAADRRPGEAFALQRRRAQVQAPMPWILASLLAVAICSAFVARSARRAYRRPPAAFQLDWVNCNPP